MDLFLSMSLRVRENLLQRVLNITYIQKVTGNREIEREIFRERDYKLLQ